MTVSEAQELLESNLITDELVDFCIKSGQVDLCTSSNKTLLHFAAESGNLSMLEKLLSAGANVDALDKLNAQELFNLTPLHYACLKGNLEAVKLLVSSGANVNSLGSKGRTPIFHAIQSGNVELFNFLVDSAKVDIFHVDWDGRSTLNEAVAFDKMEIFDRLIRLGVDPTESSIGLLEEASKNTVSLSTFEKLFAMGLQDDESGTAFGQICSFYPPEFIKFFLKNGANVNNPNVLNCAVESGKVENVRVVLDAGARITESDPIFTAVWMQEEEIVDLLIERGAKTKVYNQNGISLLQAAKSTGNSKIIKKISDSI